MSRTRYSRFHSRTACIRLLLFCCGLFITPALRAQQATEAWATRYDSPGHANDIATAVVVDNAGNSYVTGNSSDNGAGASKWVTVKYSPAGQQLWIREYSGARASAIAVDNAGGIYVTGTSNAGPVTVRYDAATGAQSWLSTYNGPANATALAVDNAGGVYITGQSSTSAGSNDYITVRYAAATGAQSWVSTYNGPDNGNDYASAIAVDNAGGVYVTGTSYGTTTWTDYATVRYAAATGAQSWASRYNGPVSQYDYGRAIAVDNAGGVYVTGTSYNFKNSDYVTVRYAAATGAQSWVSRYDGAGNDQVAAIAVDNAGGVYVTGSSSTTTSTPATDYATVRYAAATGAQSWASRYNGPANGADFAQALAVDNAGGVYVTGTSYNGAESDYATLRYAATDGAVVWTKLKAGLKGLAMGLAVDNSGNVLVTGYAQDPVTNYDFLTVKYSQAVPGGSTFDFYRAINLNGPALTLDGNAWAGSTAPHYSTNGAAFQNQGVPLIPATDAARTGMIRTAVYGPNLRVRLSAVPAGTYQVYAYVWEDNNAEVFSLHANGQVVQRNYNSGPAGTWARLGPYTVTLAATGSVQLSTTGGWANFSGIELWKQQTTTPPATNFQDSQSLPFVTDQAQAYPNPSADGRFHLLLPATLQGEVTYRLLSAMGKQVKAGTLSVSATGTAELDFSPQLNELNGCYLQLKGAQGQAYLKLLSY